MDSFNAMMEQHCVRHAKLTNAGYDGWLAAAAALENRTSLARVQLALVEQIPCASTLAARYKMSEIVDGPISDRLGSLFPDLLVETDLGSLSVHAYFGSCWGMLFSHPRDFTPVCTTELAAAARAAPDFAARGVRLLALSCDSVAEHVAWKRDICAVAGGGAAAAFPIIADASRAVAARLGMLDASETDERGMPATVRKVFVIGPDRRVKATLAYPTAVGRSFDELLRLVDALQLTAAQPSVATPADWAPGGEVVLQPTLAAAEAAVAFPDHRTVALPSSRTYLRYAKPSAR